MGYLVKPFQKSDLMPAIDIALARNAELIAVRKEAKDKGEQLDARKSIDRAKGYLMDQQGMTEADAFRYIQKRAMDERRSMRAIAEEVVSEPSGTTPP
jgi:response regulator NasT